MSPSANAGWSGTGRGGGGEPVRESRAPPPHPPPDHCHFVLSHVSATLTSFSVLPALYEHVLSVAFPLAAVRVGAEAGLRVRGDVFSSEDADGPCLGTRGYRPSSLPQARRPINSDLVGLSQMYDSSQIPEIYGR